MSKLAAEDISVTLIRRRVLDRVSLDVTAGEVVGLLGPNGAGKSTLLRVMAGVLTPRSGTVHLDDRLGDAIHPSERAKRIGYLPQGAECHWSLEVEQVVALGRLPHRGRWSGMSATDWRIVERAMGYADVSQYRGRAIHALSMGERARVLLARALAGEPEILLADEPVAGLDPAHQLEVMELVQRMAENGAAVVVVLHDLTLAARYCTRLALLYRGRLVASGSEDSVLTPANLRDCFGVRVHSGTSPEGRFVIPVERLPVP